MSTGEFDADNVTKESLNAAKCGQLQKYLKEHGITSSNKKKDELVDLCHGSIRMKIPKIDHEDEHIASETRRTVNGVTHPDPFNSTTLVWNDDLVNMPSIDFFDTTTFLINYCGWTKERVKRRKNDNSYQLHCSGHIHNVQLSQIDSTLYFVRARCVPETRQSAEPYKLWVLLEKSGLIHSAECSCVAGDGSCKHVVALLYGMNEMVTSLEDRSEVGVTDTAAYWNKPKRVCRPLEVENLDIRTDTTTPLKQKPSAASGYKPVQNVDHRKMEKEIKKILKATNTKAVALYTLSDSDDSSSDSMDIESYPPNIIDLINDHGVENIGQYVSDAYIEEVAELTNGQSINEMWHYQRKGRLTASNFYNAINYKGDNPNNHIVKSVLGKYEFSSEAVEYGRKFESVARQQYIEHMRKTHVSFQCKETGVMVFKEFPFIAASPDGVVECKCCSKGLVEIKCPFKFQNEQLQEAMSKNSSCILSDGKYQLKRDLSSPYYVQILGQMAVCKSSYCDFVLFTRKGLHVERIPFNSELWDNVYKKLKVFYNTFLLPVVNTQ